MEGLVFKKLYDKEFFDCEIYPVGEQLYRRLAYKPGYIVNIDNPLIPRGEMRVKCPLCDRFLKRTEGWQSKNKSFRAQMFCAGCGKNYLGRVRIKLEFDGLNIKTDAIGEDVTAKKE